MTIVFSFDSVGGRASSVLEIYSRECENYCPWIDTSRSFVELAVRQGHCAVTISTSRTITTNEKLGWASLLDFVPVFTTTTDWTFELSVVSFVLTDPFIHSFIHRSSSIFVFWTSQSSPCLTHCTPIIARTTATPPIS